VKAVMAAAAEPTVVVDAIAMSATKVGIAQALIDVDTLTVFRLKQQNHSLCDFKIYTFTHLYIHQ
jgi:hypothetical protein